MSAQGSVTKWIDQLQAGEHDAAAKLWERYFQRLTEIARAKLKNTPRRAADEEDIALSAFDSFCRGAEKERFPNLIDRDNLWRLLVVITARKASHLRRDAGRLKRGVVAAENEEIDLANVLDSEPTPEFAAQIAEEHQRLLDRLRDEELKSVAGWKMEGYTNKEIADKLGCGLSSVSRKLRAIRAIWTCEAVE